MQSSKYRTLFWKPSVWWPSTAPDPHAEHHFFVPKWFRRNRNSMANFPLLTGYYSNSSYLDSQRMTSLVDQHVSVISTVGSLRPFPSTYSEVHDPLNILDEPGRKTSGAFFTEAESGAGIWNILVFGVFFGVIRDNRSAFCFLGRRSLSGAAPCMFGVSSPFTSQDPLLVQQRIPSSSEVQDLVSSLPPIHTVFMGAGGVQWCRKHDTSAEDAPVSLTADISTDMIPLTANINCEVQYEP